ncbi:MAG TPA: acyltransferase, partial [bacterium]|nr:acyltransferase [bacterium]
MRAPSGPGDGAIQAVDLARTLAILPVLALHATARLLPPGQALPGLWDHLQRNGAYGVSLFFMISGFLITRTLDRGRDGAFQARWGAFYARRAGRILPLLALDLLLGLALWRCFQNDPPGFGYSLNLPLNAADPGFWLPLLFFAFNWARALWALNDWGSIGVHWAVLWSLAVEEQFYLVYPLVLRALGRVRNLVLFLVFLLAAGFGWRWFVYLQPLNNGLDWKWGSFGYFDQLGLGIGLYFAQKEWGGRLAGRP